MITSASATIARSFMSPRGAFRHRKGGDANKPILLKNFAAVSKKML
jgi:hypothetical protein